MNMLPTDIQNIIWKEYWISFYKHNIIDEIHKINNDFNSMISFLTKHFFFNENEFYDKQIKFYLIKYNNFIKNLNDGKKIFYISTRPKLKYCYDIEYINSNVFSKIPSNLKLIAAFCLLHCPKEKRYDIHHRFTKI